VVFPGGADQGYCRTLNGEGNRRIRRFVEAGGAYVGFCAGGYYGSGRCEFEVGNKILEVIGDRELAFFPGIDRGGAFSGFVYNSEKGARAAELQVNKTALPLGSVPHVFRSYYNGGGVFVDAAKYKDQGVEVLASYTENIAVDSGKGAAAVVYCKTGQGAALLTGPHPEFVFLGKPADNWSLTRPRFVAANLEQKEDVPGFDKVVEVLAGDEKHRMDFMKACLTKLGLKVTEEQTVPSLSRIHLSSLPTSTTRELLASLKETTTMEEGEEYIKDDNDRFHIVKHSAWSLGTLYTALPSTLKQEGKTDHDAGSAGETNRIVDYNSITKEVLFHEIDHPVFEQTPYFNHHSYYSNLSDYQTATPQAKSQFGNHLLYGEVVTSTNTLLEKNTQLLRRLPTGFTAVATCQVAGRGRGSNVWVSPPGSLMFSTVMRHPIALMQQAPVVFVQYLAALAVVEGVKRYDGDLYKDMPIKLKWPNDIYALDPAKASTLDINCLAHGNSKKLETTSTDEDGDRDKYVKIGGILVNSHYNAEDYIAVCGIGLNLSNNLPTTSLNALLTLLQTPRPSPSNSAAATTTTTTPPSPLPPFTPEKLLPSILTSFDALYTRFLRTGFDDFFLDKYHQHWLHGGQMITLEAEGGPMKARIRGISADHGLLVVEELEEDGDGDCGARSTGTGTGRMWKLQSDSNSFDFFHGLVRRRM
jgi:biotin---protein ligase